MRAKGFKLLVARWAAIIEDNRDYLIDLDSVVGDGDLGLTMSDGFKVAGEAVAAADEEDIGKLSYLAGKAMSTAVPSTMGTLMASGLMNAGKALKGSAELDAKGIALFFRAYFDGVQARGKAALGEKTFLDGLYPAVESLEADAEKGTDIKEAADNAARRTQQAFESTKGMLAKHGRAATRGENSRELLDPGAAVAKLLLEGYAGYINETGRFGI